MGLSESRFMKVHFSPVGKPAPPLPRSPDCLTSSVTASGVICRRAFSTAEYPPCLRYTSNDLMPGTSICSRRTLLFISYFGSCHCLHPPAPFACQEGSCAQETTTQRL